MVYLREEIARAYHFSISFSARIIHELIDRADRFQATSRFVSDNEEILDPSEAR